MRGQILDEDSNSPDRENGTNKVESFSERGRAYCEAYIRVRLKTAVLRGLLSGVCTMTDNACTRDGPRFAPPASLQTQIGNLA